MATLRKPAAVSMDPALFERAKARAQALGFATFSAYVSQLIRSDIISGGGMSVLEEQPAKPVTEERKEVRVHEARQNTQAMKTPVLVLLSLILVMQFVQAWIISRLPAEQLRLQAEITLAAQRAATERLAAQAEAREKAAAMLPREPEPVRMAGEDEGAFAVRRALWMARH